MSNDEHDPILDACLDEILGGQTPPDLTPRIMQAWSLLPPALPTEQPVESPAEHRVTIKAISRKPAASTSPKRVAVWMASLVIAVGIVAIGLGVSFTWRPQSPSIDTDVVENTVRSAARDRDRQPVVAPNRNEVVEHLPAERDRKSPEVITPEFASQPPFATEADRSPRKFTINSPPRATALADAEVIATIDSAIQSAWEAHNVKPTAEAGDVEYAGHLFQRVLGRDPTPEELQTFDASRAKDKRAKLIDDLLTREEHVVEFARHWATLWSDSLIGRTGATGGTKQRREGLQQYLRRAFQQAKPMDQITSELLTATGSGEIGTPEYNGAANFLLTHYENQATRATSQVARVFLGKRIQCAQCHDHPGDSSLAQNRFWELNTFLRQMAVAGRGSDTKRLANQDFLGDGGGDGVDAEVFYETANGQIKVAYPALPGATNVPRSGRLDEFDRRAGLARYVVESPDFRRAVVNRVWSHIFGYGFTSPVDDLGPHNPPSHPELLNALADQFAAHNHDLRSLIRWMVSSEPFQRRNESPGSDLVDAPELGGERWFSRTYASPVPTSTAQESLLALAKATAAGQNPLGVGTTANLKPTFPTPSGSAVKQTIAPSTIASQTVGQSLNFIPSTISSILDATMSTEQKLDHLFLVTLQRSPTRRERGLIKEITGDNMENDRDALLRIWWTLSRSSD